MKHKPNILWDCVSRALNEGCGNIERLVAILENSERKVRKLRAFGLIGQIDKLRKFAFC